MDKKKIKEIRTLVIRLGVLAAIVIGVIIIIQIVKSANSSTETQIDDTPLRVEQIKAILELNTIRFKDEVVVDTLEMYKDGFDVWEKLGDFNTFDEFVKPSPIKRRLTLIVKGELLYGVNLKTSDFDMSVQKDTLVITLPEPELLSATVNPLNTDVFVENGTWSDYARRKMMIKAKKRMIKNGEDLHLPLKAREPLERTIKQLVKSDKPVKIIFVK
jgi:hypothetical protein